jgi:hypothetical protein
LVPAGGHHGAAEEVGSKGVALAEPDVEPLAMPDAATTASIYRPAMLLALPLNVARRRPRIVCGLEGVEKRVVRSCPLSASKTIALHILLPHRPGHLQRKQH